MWFPPFYAAYLNRGLIVMDEGDLARAANDLTTAVGLQPDDPQAYSLRGDLYVKMGRLDLAATDYARACAMGDKGACQKAALPVREAK